MATRYVSSLAAGAGDGSSGNPWTLAQAVSGAGTSDTVNVKGDGTYTTAANLVIASSRALWRGYSVTPGDAGQATIQAAAGVTALLSVTGFGIWFHNLILDAANIANYCLDSGQGENGIRGCRLTRFANTGFHSTGSNGVILDSEVDTGKAGSTAGVSFSSGGTVEGCYIHANPCTGVLLPSGGVCIRNIVAANTGAASDGISFGFTARIEMNRSYGNGRDGIRQTDTYGSATVLRRNILVGSLAGYGLNDSVSAALSSWGYDQNAFYNNALGATHNETTSNDITLTGDPFTNAAGGDFSLNVTAGAGAACRNIAYSFPGSATTDYPDLGGAQHQAGGGLLLPFGGLGGGLD